MVLVNVFPERALHGIGHDEEHAEEEQHGDAEMLAELRLRLGHPDHEGDEIADGVVVFLRRELAGLGQRQLVVGAHHLLALQFPQHMRHADAVEGDVVPAGRPLLVA